MPIKRPIIIDTDPSPDDAVASICEESPARSPTSFCYREVNADAYFNLVIGRLARL